MFPNYAHICLYAHSYMRSLVRSFTRSALSSGYLGKSGHLHSFIFLEYVVISVCVIGFLFGLSMCTSGGYYMFTLIDDKSASWNLLLVAFLEVILVGWIYGADRFLDNIKEMDMNLGPFFHWYWKICWQFITPGIMVILILFSFINHAPTEVNILHK